MTDMRRNLDRRSFLGAAGAAAAAAALVACGNSTPPAPATAAPAAKPTEAPKPAAAEPTKPAAAPAGATTAPATSGGATPAAAASSGAGPKEIFTMVDKTWSDLGQKAATELFNKENADLGQVTLEETAQGWDTKVLQQIRDKNLRWSGHGYAPFFDSYNFIKQGLVAPIDDLLKSAKFPWAQKQKDIYLTSKIYDALQLDGKQYYIPMKANVHLVAYRSDHIQAAGYESFPKTWDETDKMVAKLKPVVEKMDAVAFGISRDTFRTLCTSFATMVDRAWDDDGILKIESPEWIGMLEMFKKWKDMGMVRIDNQADSADAFQKGKYTFNLGSHSSIRLGRQVAPDKVKGANPPQPNTTAPAKTWIHIDSGFVFPNAPNAQLAANWLLAMLGPEGNPADAWWKGVLTFSGQPVYSSMVDKHLKPNKEISEVADVMALVPNSQIVTLPVAGAYSVMNAKLWPYLDDFFAGKGAAKDLMGKAMKDTKDELAKQKK